MPANISAPATTTDRAEAERSATGTVAPEALARFVDTLARLEARRTIVNTSATYTKDFGRAAQD